MAILLDSVGGVSFDGSAVGWVRTPYGVRIAEESDMSKAFRTLRDHINYALAIDGKINAKDGNRKDDALNSSVEDFKNSIYSNTVPDSGFSNSNTSADSELINGKTTYTAFNYTDTRVGGNDAINPYWQFNRDDDITPAMFAIGGEDPTTSSRRGMGRVYAETYEANQSILWLQMGVPEFANLVELFTASGNADAAKAMNQGSLASLGTKIITLVVKGALWLIAFPIVAPLHLIKWLGSLSANEITKFYHFRPAMPMYYDMVNSMLAYLAVNLGIYPAYLMRRSMDRQLATKFQDLADHGDFNENNTDGKLKSVDGTKLEDTALPELLKSGPDIYKILNRRRIQFDTSMKDVTTRVLLGETASAAGSSPYPSGDKPHIKTQVVNGPNGKPLIREFNGKKQNVSYFSFLKSSILGCFDYIGFKCEKGINTTDSISNSTASSPLFESLNQISRDRLVRENQRSFLGRTLINVATGSSMDGILKKELALFGLNVASATGLGSSGSIIASGNGFFDVPEMWSGSSFDRSISFNIQLRARYGDPVSIYQSIYIPLMMLIAAACPRAIGDNMYTSPFIVKAYCKGKFSISCGMITSINITRGKDAFGWSDDELPTAIDVQLTIKDMSPNMFLAMQDIGLFDTFSRNESIMDYLDTLSALGIYERMYTVPRMLRKLTAAVLVKKNTIFSKEWWAFKTAKSRAGLAFSAMVPWRPLHEKEDIEVTTSSN